MERQIPQLVIMGHFHENEEGGVKLKSETTKYIIALVSFGIVILALVSVIVNLQSQLSQKGDQIRTLQEEIEELQDLLGPVKKGAWNTIATFGGSSGLITDYFYVAGTDLRMNWTCFAGAEESAVFSFHIYKEGQSECVEAFTNLQDQGTAFLRNLEKANYYLHISEDKIDQWSITVETWIPS